MESVLCLPLRDRNQTPFGAVYVDAPDRRDAFRNQDTKLLESFCDLAAVVLENLRQQERRLRTERLASVGLTANYLLHDLKTPLTVIQGCAEILGSESPASTEMADTIIRQVTRLTNMARDVYDFSRGLAGMKQESCEATSILEDITALFANEVKQRGLTLHIGPTAGQVWAHRGKLVRVLANLVQNAMEALAEGGHIWVEFATSAAGGGEFHVRDNGPGLPEEISRHLFEAFYTSGKQSGRGLGMAIVHDIVTAHGGHISVGSGPDGLGTCFTVQLPKAPANA
jgi:signal transduction histidine kinase